MITKTILGALLVLYSAQAYAKTQCHSERGRDSYWSYRLIDGHKCWFKGARMAKRDLYWPSREHLPPPIPIKSEPPSPKTEIMLIVPSSAFIESRWPMPRDLEAYTLDSRPLSEWPRLIDLDKEQLTRSRHKFPSLFDRLDREAIERKAKLTEPK